MSYLQDTFGTIITLALIGIGLFILGAAFSESMTSVVNQMGHPLTRAVASGVQFPLFNPPTGTLVTLALIGVVTLTFKGRL